MRLTTLLLALALVGICAAALPSYHFSLKEAEQRFAKWAKEHGKSYIDREARKALLVFHHNLERIEEHNRKAAQGLKTFTMKLNKFADLTEEEFAERFLGFRYRPDKMTNPVHLTNETDVPTSVDWRTKGAVTPVKDQGQCGSCWAFSATGALEGANFLKTGKLVALSEQELLDCDGTDNACNGGLMDNAFAWVEKNGGIDSEDDWKYLGHETVVDKCPKAQAAKHVGTCSNYTDVVANNETQLMLAASKQPVSVAIEADQGGFQFYESGIFSGDCGTNLDHGVLLVGYGTEDKQDYWIVKNSWGDMWGEDGYIRIARNVKAAEGQCGIAMAASYPTA